ncbi:hypothetical protein CQW39_30980 [Streptomyces griseofuscus]|nr:hypothetical protein CQW39_30980 [Streptomyces griseofuscus]
MLVAGLAREGRTAFKFVAADTGEVEEAAQLVRESGIPHDKVWIMQLAANDVPVRWCGACRVCGAGRGGGRGRRCATMSQFCLPTRGSVSGSDDVVSEGS